LSSYLDPDVWKSLSTEWSYLQQGKPTFEILHESKSSWINRYYQLSSGCGHMQYLSIVESSCLLENCSILEKKMKEQSEYQGCWNVASR
jgi:hypothetical protein